MVGPGDVEEYKWVLSDSQLSGIALQGTCENVEEGVLTVTMSWEHWKHLICGEQGRQPSYSLAGF